MKSLRDQLLKAGLTDKQSVKNVQKQKKKQPKRAKNTRNEVSESAKLALQAQQDKAEHDKKLNLKQQQEAQQKAVLAQVKQLVASSKIDREQGELAYNFTFDGKIKTIYVTADQKQQLTRSQIAIVTLKPDQFDLVPRKVAEKINQRESAYVIQSSLEAVSKDQKGTDVSEQANSEDEDPYAAYEIPDDLHW